jgi:hypothetical protein
MIRKNTKLQNNVVEQQQQEHQDKNINSNSNKDTLSSYSNSIFYPKIHNPSGTLLNRSRRKPSLSDKHPCQTHD